MKYDYIAISKRKIKYSSDVYFLDYKENFELFLSGEKVKSFESLKELNKFLFENYINKRPAARVYVYTNYFSEIQEYYKNSYKIGFKILNKKNNTETTAFQIYGGITYKQAKFYLGTDKSDAENSCELISKFHSRIIKHNFTSSLNDILFKEDEELQNFGSSENLPFGVLQELYKNASLAPIIYSDINKELKNVYCYDFDSAYIAQYYQTKFPYKFIEAKEIDDKNEFFVRAKIYNIKAKNPRFLSLSVADKSNGKNILFPDKNSKRVLKADEITLSYFYKLETSIIFKDYTFEKIVFEKIWKIEFKALPQSFRNKVLDLYNEKEELKKQGKPYADKKVILNRIHGLFLTKKDFCGKKEQIYRSLPAQIGFYAIARQRRIMRDLVELIGLENIVQSHTDSFKVKFDCGEIVKNYNELHKTKYSETLGLLEFEGKMEKVIYFSNTRAKYILDNKFNIKHGGISDEDANKILESYDYNTLNKDSFYEHEIDSYFTKENDKNILKKIFQKRAFAQT